MNPILRAISSAFVALFVGVFIISGVHAIGDSIYPPPPNLDYDNYEMLKAYFGGSIPLGALMFILMAHISGTITGVFVASSLTLKYQKELSVIMGLAYLSIGIAMAFMIPAPRWFAALDLVCYLPAAFLGFQLWRKVLGKSLI